MSLHKDHRSRLRRRFLENGLDSFEDHEALEMLLYYCIARKDTNDLAHMLLAEFGSLPKVLSASPEQLRNIEGVGEYTATYLAFINDFTRFVCAKKKSEEFVALETLADCGEYLYPRYIGRRNEIVTLLCLDSKCKVLGCKVVGEGSVNSAAVPIRRIVETALQLNASTVVLAHNHPGGVAVPSAEDVSTTRMLANALAAVDVVLADHIIFADEECISLRTSEYFPEGVFVDV